MPGKSEEADRATYSSSGPSPCPAAGALNAIVQGARDVDDQLAAHIAVCDACQARLDALSDDGSLEHYRSHARNLRDFSRLLNAPLADGDLGSIGEFAIEAVIAAGGMGVVYRGRDTQLRRAVAVKVLSRASGPMSDARMERESRALAKLNHPNIVPVYHAGRTDDGRPWLVMPLIAGDSLKDRLLRGPMGNRDAANIILQVARGLATAHDAELIHRDIKPANILLDEQDGQAKLADFGLVRTRDDATLTQHDILCGTPEYMSPEQAVNPGKDGHDHRSDIYSLGVTLYECLTGIPPFRGEPLAIIDQHRSIEPIRPSRLDPSIPRDLETICLRAISKNPDRRFPTAAAMSEDLQSFLDGRPIQSRDTTQWERIVMWSDRHRALATALCLLIVSLLSGSIISTLLWLKSSSNVALANERADSLQRRTTQLQGAVDTFFARVVGDQSEGMQLSTEFRNVMVGDLLEHYDSLIHEHPNDKQLAVSLGNRALSLVEPLQDLQLFGPVMNLLSWVWGSTKPFAMDEAAEASELLVAGRAAMELAANPRLFSPGGALRFINEETLDVSQMLQQAGSLAERAESAGGGMPAAKIQLWTEVLSIQQTPTQTAEQLARMQQILALLDEFGAAHPEDVDLYYRRDKIRRLIAGQSAPLEAHRLRIEANAILEQKVGLLEQTNRPTKWTRRSIAIGTLFQAVDLLKAQEPAKAFARFDEAIAQFNEILGEDPRFIVCLADVAEAEWMKCQQLWAHGHPEATDYEQSVKRLRQILSIDPKQARSRQRLAAIQLDAAHHLHERGDAESAAAYVASAVEDFRAVYDLPGSFQAEFLDRQFREFRERAAKLFDDMGRDQQAEALRDEEQQHSIPHLDSTIN